MKATTALVLLALAVQASSNPLLSGLIGGLGETLGAVKAGVGGAVGSLVEGVGGAVEGVGKTVEGLTGGVSNIVEAAGSGVSDLTAGLGDKLEGLGDSIESHSQEKLETSDDSTGKYQKETDYDSEHSSQTSKTTEIEDHSEKGSSNAHAAGSDVKGVTADAGDNHSQDVSNVKGGSKDERADAGDKSGDLGDKIKDRSPAQSQSVNDKDNTNTTKGKNYYESEISEGQSGKNIQDDKQHDAEAVIGGLGETLDAVHSGVDGAIGSLVQGVGGAVEGVGKTVEGLTEDVSNVVDAVGSGVSDLTAGLGGKLEGLGNKIESHSEVKLESSDDSTGKFQKTTDYNSKKENSDEKLYISESSESNLSSKN